MSFASTILGLSPDFYCPFNESSGTTGLDATGNGHTFTYTTSDFTLGNAGMIPSNSDTCAEGTVAGAWASNSYHPSAASSPAMSFMAAFRCPSLLGALAQLQNNFATPNGHSLRINASNQVAIVLGNGTTSATVTDTTAITAAHNYLVIATYGGTTVSLQVYDLSSAGAETSATGSLTAGNYTTSNALQASQTVCVGQQALWSAHTLSSGEITTIVTAALASASTQGDLLGML